MDSPSSHLHERRKSQRYPAHLPVLIRLEGASPGAASVSARSVNISENGILLSSDSPFSEGSSVELTVNGAPEPYLLTVHGKVLRVDSQDCGKFAIAVQCGFPFRIAR